MDSLNAQFRLLRVPWCATFASACGDKSSPKIRSARAKDFALRGKTIPSNAVLLGGYKLKGGEYAVKSRQGGNHVDIVETADGSNLSVIGGNVSDAVTRRKMQVSSYKFFTPTR